MTNDSGYNVRSEVIGELMGANDYSYAYDPIGNRLTATNNGTGWNYLSNPLNQYTNIADGVIVEPEYDLDGNMTATGDGWHYFWNGENRMIMASNTEHVVTYAYDHQGRMVSKAVNDSARHYLWDGYNIVQALTHSQTHTLTNSFIWGLDLSGTLQNAGGVGGLLVEVRDGEPYFAAFDANGNVTEYLSADGTLATHYEYSPFGELVVQSGDLADTFTHRFSTKPWCAVTGQSEYEFRKYEPGMGRWLSRDPSSDTTFFSARIKPKQNDIWKEFCDSITHCNRFFLPSGSTFHEMLSRIGEAASYRHSVDRTLYRGRMSSSNIMYECYEAVQMLAPSPECTPDGRANVCGIPVLYAAEAERTVVAELRGWKSAKLHIVALHPLRELHLVDLSRRDAVTISQDRSEHGQAELLRDLMLRMDDAFSRPYSESDTKLHYVPTQYVASYFKSAGADGIRYSSAMDTGGHNVAIFDTTKAVETRSPVRRFNVEAIGYRAKPYIPFHERPGCRLTVADEF